MVENLDVLIKIDYKLFPYSVKIIDSLARLKSLELTGSPEYKNKPIPNVFSNYYNEMRLV